MSDVQTLLANYPESVQATAARLRAIVHDLLPDANEDVTGHKTINYSTDAGVMKGGMVYIAPLKASVNLGFVDGIDLDDPDGLLKGTGKRLRHIKFTQPDDVDRQEAAVRALIAQAKALKV